MQLVYEIGLTKDVRPVLCLQENTVTGAADGYARMAGKPAFTLLHVGAGFANGIANLQNAGRANTSLVNIVVRTRPTISPIIPSMNSSMAISSTWPRASRIGHTKPNRPAIWPYSGAGNALRPDRCRQDLHGYCPHQLPLGSGGRSAGACRTDGDSESLPRDDSRSCAFTNGKKTGIVLGSHSLYGDGLELAGRIAAKTGADLLGETTRPASPEGKAAFRSYSFRISPTRSPGSKTVSAAHPRGGLFPVSTFAYKGRPLLKVPEGCEVSTLATVDHDMLSALSDLAKALGAPSEPAVPGTNKRLAA